MYSTRFVFCLNGGDPMSFKVKTTVFFMIMTISALPVFAATHTVNQTGTAFVPDNITIEPGDTVEWIWSGGFHTVTSGIDGNDPTAGNMFDANLSSTATTFSYIFADEGDFDYFCRPHVSFGMDGVIHVVASVANESATWNSVKSLYR
jgi:plastocyanin